MYIKVKDYTFKVVNKDTIKGYDLLKNYYFSNFNDTELHDVYKSCSTAKLCAMGYCKAMMHNLNGSHGHITSHNSQVFCFAFEFKCDGKTKVVYITPYNDYIIDGVEHRPYRTTDI